MSGAVHELVFTDPTRGQVSTQNRHIQSVQRRRGLSGLDGGIDAVLDQQQGITVLEIATAGIEGVALVR